ncbi:MAG: tRNA (guanine(10)-N(2))-dimethyltransferase [Infirmifilum sp.]
MDPCVLRETREGKAIIQHCDLKELAVKEGYVDPAWAPVFYNPRMQCSRDLSTVIVSVYAKYTGRNDLHVVDVMCGTGARGIRYALEVPGVSKVTLNDANPKAAELTRRNVALNSVTDMTQVENREAHGVLATVKADVIDLDPFGTPAPFVHPALKALRHKGLLCVTATDLPPLLGIYPRACMRKYFSLSFKSEFSREMAVRILLYFVAREAAKLGRRIRPFYSYYLDHHVRICVIVEKSPESSFLERNIGFLLYNPSTLERTLVRIPDFQSALSKAIISPPYQLGGPLWLGKLWDERTVVDVESEYVSRLDSYSYCKRGAGIVRRIREEFMLNPFYYTTEKIASTFHLPFEAPPLEVVRKLSSMGYPSSLTHFDPKGVRTEAPVKTILEIWHS